MFKYLARKIKPYLQDDFHEVKRLADSDVQIRGWPGYYKISKDELKNAIAFYQCYADTLLKIIGEYNFEVEELKKELVNTSLNLQGARKLGLDSYVQKDTYCDNNCCCKKENYDV